MPDKSYTRPGETHLTAFVTTEHYVVGVGETIDQLQASGEWLATDEPADVRR